jgi:hypothetical protein
MAKGKDKEEEAAPEAEAEEPLVASELDERTHAEVLMLYHESAESIRFGKSQQWTTLGSTLAVFVILGLIGIHAPKADFLFKLLIALSIATSVGSIYSLVIYQFWQNTEREKITSIAERLSNFTRRVRGYTSPREANVHRYVLLTFMALTIVLANWVLILTVSRAP